MIVREKFLIICLVASAFSSILPRTCVAESLEVSTIPDKDQKETQANLDLTTIKPQIEDDAKLSNPINDLTNANDDRKQFSDSSPIERNISLEEEEEKEEGRIKDDKNDSSRFDELDDLQHGGSFENVPKTIDEDDVVILPVPIDNDRQGPTSEIEWIEEDEEGEEDPDAAPVVQAMIDVSRSPDDAVQGQLGIMLALFLVMFLVAGYIGFVVWRRFIEKRYGSREILVNEEDMIDPNDMKHFSL